MNLGIHGRYAVVAAATTGLGFGVARTLIDEGVRVYLCGSHQGRLDEALEALGPRASGSVIDLTEPDSGAELARRAKDESGQVDILVTNGPGPSPTTALEMRIPDLEQALRANLLSAVELCTALVPAMRDRGWGRVVGITSLGARESFPNLATSGVARSALTMYLKSLADEVREDGVTVNSVQPGAHDTARYRRIRGRAPGDGDRIGSVAGFGGLVAMLCSDQAHYVSGIGLPIAGGTQAAI